MAILTEVQRPTSVTPAVRPATAPTLTDEFVTALISVGALGLAVWMFALATLTLLYIDNAPMAFAVALTLGAGCGPFAVHGVHGIRKALPPRYKGRCRRKR